MRLHRVRLAHYRGVHACEVEFADTGVTIVEGRNEVGKTSLIEALDLIIEYPDSSNAAPIKSVRPVDRDKGAEVEIELSTGEYRFAYRKRWHRDRQTELTIHEPTREQLTGREAHDRVTAILDETLDDALWTALKLQQGGELRQAAFGAGTSLGQALDRAAGGEAAGAVDDDLWSRVLDERALYWTATGQRKADRSAREAKVVEARAEVAALQAELRELDKDAEAVAGLIEQAVELEQRVIDTEHEVVDLQSRSEQIERCRAGVREATLEHDAETPKRDLCAAAVGRRQELIEQVARLRAASQDAEGELARAAPRQQAARERYDELTTALDVARSALAEAETAHETALADETFRRQEIELEQLSERHERVVAAQVSLGEAEAVIERSLVDDELLHQIEEANYERVRAQAAAASGAVSVDVTALVDTELRVDESLRALTEGDTTAVEVTESAEIVVADLVRLDIRAGSEAQELAVRRDEAETALAGLCARAGVADVDEARTANQARAAAERARKEASTTIEQDLRDLTPESLAAKVDGLARRTGAYPSGRPPGPPIPGDFEAAKSVAGERAVALADARETIERLDAATRSAAADLNEAEVGDATLAETARQARGALQLAEQELEAARAEQPDEALVQAVDEATARVQAVWNKLSEAQDRLRAQDPESVEARLENAVTTRRRCEDELDTNRRETDRLRTRLEIKGEEGLALDLDEAMTALTHLESEHERVEARAAAVELLHDVMDEHRTRARNRYVAPFRDGIEQLGRIVFGESLQVELDDDLLITRRTLDGVTVDFDQLSTGAREQLGLIARLAGAAIVSADGGAPVVFDDALGWTDPTRLDRMGAAIALAGRDCQVIVLTCTPGRYAHVGSASVVRLDR